MLDLYENTVLKNSDNIFETASKQLNAGEINYLDWVMLIKEKINIHQNYLDTIWAYNNTMIEIQKIG
jgi:cobalt-zinc-cadmium resistance protein CzcA